MPQHGDGGVPPFSKNTTLKLQIAGIEASQMRAVREAVLGYPGALGRLQALDAQIAAFRSQLDPE